MTVAPNWRSQQSLSPREHKFSTNYASVEARSVFEPDFLCSADGAF